MYYSIIGDSISTLSGFNPENYAVFFSLSACFIANITGPEDTWWWQVINHFGGELLVNNSFSGSQAAQLKGRNVLFPSACAEERTGGLHSDDRKPDIIIIYIGTNDWGRGVCPYADKTENPLESFEGGYGKMLADVKKNYPEAEIYVCTLPKAYKRTKPDFCVSDIINCYSIAEYNGIIRKKAVEFSCRLLDLASYGVPYDSIDGGHPSNIGMKTLSELMIKEIEKEKTDTEIS